MKLLTDFLRANPNRISYIFKCCELDLDGLWDMTTIMNRRTDAPPKLPEPVLISQGTVVFYELERITYFCCMRLRMNSY